MGPAGGAPPSVDLLMLVIVELGDIVEMVDRDDGVSGDDIESDGVDGVASSRQAPFCSSQSAGRGVAGFSERLSWWVEPSTLVIGQRMG